MHKPVLLQEVIKLLDPKPGEFIIDGTVNGGGHAAEIFKRIRPSGVFLGIDWDGGMLQKAEAKISAEIKDQKSRTRNLILRKENYANLTKILEEENLGKADGLLLDLGFSSTQLKSGRGFSFQEDEPLDMRYDLSENLTAFEAVNQLEMNELANIFWKFGEERYARSIAKGITESRRLKPIRTTEHLAKIIEKSVPQRYLRGRINPATKVFQALRIYVNRELDNLEVILKNLVNVLKPGGRVLIMSFHSLEDRMVKNGFREMQHEKVAEILTKKPIVAANEEVRDNPRARSAKLRAIRIL